MLRESEEFSLPPIFCITYMTMNKYYPVDPVNIHIQSLMNNMQDNNRVVTIKKGKRKLTTFFGNGEGVISIYAQASMAHSYTDYHRNTIQPNVLCLLHWCN